ncbi:hypothetical protein [Variovorax sp. OV329]|uniref:hypothetical protein n=1 Tax=Variovorax sp. OV329 TaxID=1882825 RepID=UPI001113A682|nr:hypothetical protein [Variovorax sp. OV329]
MAAPDFTVTADRAPVRLRASSSTSGVTFCPSAKRESLAVHLWTSSANCGGGGTSGPSGLGASGDTQADSSNANEKTAAKAGRWQQRMDFLLE